MIEGMRPPTPRQLELAALLAAGLTPDEAAERLGLAVSTVKNLLYGNSNGFVGLYGRVGARDRTDAALWYARTYGFPGEVAMSIPANETPNEREIDWTLRPDKPHFAAQSLPAGSRAWTDYRGDVRELARDKPAEGSQPVYVRDPLAAGERAVVSSEGPGQGYQWTARRA